MSRPTKILLIVFSVITLLVLAGIFTKAVSSFFDSNRLVFHAPVEINFYTPVLVEKRLPEIQKETLILDYPGEINTPIKKYICDKFGPYDCKVALAIAEAESNFREDAVNLNSGKSLDTGIFQVNSVHWSKPGCSLKDLVDPYKNVDCAYSIFKAQGWTPWVVFLSGSFLSHLE